MSFVSKHSNECASSELDVFAVPPTQTSVEGAKIVPYSPIAKNPHGPLEFKIFGTTDTYIDLSQTYLYVQVQITDENDAAVTDLKVAPANLFLHTMFSQVDVQLNNFKVTSSVNTYPYRAYFETLLNYGHDAKKSHLQCSLYYKDEANQFDSINIDSTKGGVNKGFIKRRDIASKGAFDMYGRLHADVFFQDKYLIDNVQVDLKLTKSKDEFCLIGADTSKYKVKIKDAILYARHCQISNSVKLAHALALEKATLKYPIKRVELKTHSIPKGVLSSYVDNIVSGRLPNRVVFGIVDNESFNGKFSKNCFNFRNWGLTEIGLYVNGSHAANSPIQVDFATNSYSKAFYSLFSGVDKAPLDYGNDISLDDYAQGYTLFAFDLTPDMCPGEHFSLQRSGTLKIEFKFKASTTDNLVCVVYMDYDNIIEISKNRTVLTDFTI